MQQQYEAHPESSAIHAWDGNLTYRELRQRSSRLATLLLERCVGPEVTVPPYFDKSMWTAVAIHAVLKAGAAFFVLDLAFPLSRLEEMCLAVNASIVLAPASRAELAKSLASSEATMTVDNDSAAVTDVLLQKSPLHAATMQSQKVLVTLFSLRGLRASRRE